MAATKQTKVNGIADMMLSRKRSERVSFTNTLSVKTASMMSSAKIRAASAGSIMIPALLIRIQFTATMLKKNRYMPKKEAAVSMIDLMIREKQYFFIIIDPFVVVIACCNDHITKRAAVQDAICHFFACIKEVQAPQIVSHTVLVQRSWSYWFKFVN
jgi:hypothetical protein